MARVMPPNRATGRVKDQGSRPYEMSKAALSVLALLRSSLVPLTEPTSVPARPESTATKPGATVLPAASMTRAPDGAPPEPTETILPSRITTVPFSMTESPVRMRPPTMATVSCAIAGTARDRAATAPARM